MKILVWYDKHGDYKYDASTPEALDKAALTVLQERLDQGYLGYPDEAETEAEAILAAEDGKAAYRFLEARDDYEYERISLDVVR